MTWIFVLGKNPELSTAEISCYFENRGIDIEFSDGSDTILIADVEIGDPERVQFDLGGTLKIVEVYGEVSYGDFLAAFGRRRGDDREKIEELVPEVAAASIYEFSKKNFKELNLGNFKAFLNGFEIETKNPENMFSHGEVSKKGLVDDELVVGICEEKVYFGITRAVTNPFEYQKRDVGRPRPLLLGISPSRAAILVNLVGVPDKVLMDPFCGGGTIGQEALLRGLLVMLSDIKLEHVELCRENLEWLNKYGKRLGMDIGFETRSVRKMDARKLRRVEADCIATEPYLGPAFRRPPKLDDGKNAIRGVKKLYGEFLRAAYGILKDGGKIALVCPAIKTESGMLRLDIEKLAKRHRFEVLIGPIVDAEREKGKTRIVAREFVVLGKIIK